MGGKTRKKYPTRIRFFVADDIRQEGSKPIVLGLFADDVIGIVPKDGAPTKEKPYALQSLAMMFSLINCAGSFKATFSVQGPDGETIVEGPITEGLNAEGKKSIHFIAKFVPFLVASYGRYKAVITLDKKAYESEFAVQEHTQPTV
jgi:hypothetical protein